MNKSTLVFLAGTGIVIAALFVMITEPALIKSVSTQVYDSSMYMPLPKETLLLEDRLSSTPLLLYAPVGGLSGPLYWLNGPDTLTYEYQFHSRGFGPGNVTLTVHEVENPMSTIPVNPSPGTESHILPDHFSFDPDEIVTAQLNITVLPEGYRHNATIRTFWIHTGVDGMPNAVADDWVRLRMGDRPVSDISRHATASTEARGISIRKGGIWKGNTTLKLGERDTGRVYIWFQELDCETSGMSSLDTPEPTSPDWPHISVSPCEFVGRSFGNYNLTTTIDTGSLTLHPGTYCYGINVETTGSRTSSSFKIDVIP